MGVAQNCSTIGALGRGRAGACCSQRILKTSDFNHSAVTHGFEGTNYIIVTGGFPSGIPWRKDLRPGRWLRWLLPLTALPGGSKLSVMDLPRFAITRRRVVLAALVVLALGALAAAPNGYFDEGDEPWFVECIRTARSWPQL